MFMRFYNNIYQKLRFAGLILLCILLTGTINAQAQREKKVRQTVDVVLKVVDENGTPIPKAGVVIGEGVVHTETDETGSVTFKGYPDDFVTVTAKAYEKSVSLVVDLIKDNTVKLSKAKLYMTSDDNVALPFHTLKKRQITGSTYVIDGSRLEMYPSTDLRNAFTGLAGLEVREVYGAPGINAQEYLGSFGATEKINVSARGRTMTYMVDNILTDITELPLDPNEIESVSVVKDIVGKSMYGPAAADGIIYITTKRGNKNEHSLTINLERGVSSVDRMPEFVSGGDYARLNNQARFNSGLAKPYDSTAIARYDLNNPWDKFRPSVNYRDMMLKNSMPFTRANVSSSGGNDIVQYFAYLGYDGEGDIYNMGAKADYNRIVTRSNVDIQVNERFKIDFDFYGNVSIRRSPNYGYDSDFTSENSSSNPVLGLIEMPDVLGHITTVPPIALPVYASYDSVSNTPWYAVNSAYTINPIGNLEGNGYYKDQGRQGAINIVLDYDLGQLISGLRSKTTFGYNSYNMVRVGKAEDYIAYRADPYFKANGQDSIIKLTKVHLGVDQADMAKLMDYYFQRYVFFENLSYEKTFGKSHLLTSLTYYLSKTFKNDIEEPERQQNGIFTGSYSYNDKYNIMGVLNYAGTYSFAEGNRYALFPSVGASWVISEEGFMQGLKFFDYLKFRVEWGTLGVETFMSPYRYRDNWSTNNSGSAFGAASTGQWFGSGTDASVNRATPSRIGNADLTWEKSKEWSAGFDALMLKGKLAFEMTYYNTIRQGTIVQLANSLPYALGFSGARPYANYNDTRYYGLESILQFTSKAGGFTYSFGGSATMQNSERLKYDEAAYKFDYQLRTGKPSDAYFGQTYVGKFATDAEANLIPQMLGDSKLSAGDLQYKDMNGDGVIDDNDQSMIGHTAPRLFYALNIRFAYKNFDITIVGTGRAFYDVAQTNSYYWNGWGDNNYSTFVRDNIGGAYPKLTYYKVNNNFVNSNFWLTKGDYFKIQNVELGYNFPLGINKVIGARGIRLFARGANLLTISKIKDVDPEALSSGLTNYPLFRTITGGLKLNF
jgi:TonB-linked SusC/RagA family outer membrane protein